MAKQPKDPLAHRPVTDPEERRAMVAHLVRSEPLFLEVRGILTPDMLRPVEPALAAVYQVVCSYHDEHGELPPADVLRVELAKLAGDSVRVLDDDQAEEVDDFLAYAFEEAGDPASPAVARWAVNKVKQFLEERLAARAREAVAGRDTVAGDLPGLLAELTAQAETIAGLSHSGPGLAPVLPDGWDRRPVSRRRPTGLPFDHFTEGGEAEEEVVGLLAPFGSCKTLLAVSGTYEAAKWAYEQTLRPDWDGRRGLAFYVSFEEGLEGFQDRIVSYSAQVARESLRERADLGSLSTQADPKTYQGYERKLFAKALAARGRFPGERERVAAVLPVVNGHVALIDMLAPGKGGGYVEEIRREVEAVCRRANGYPVRVWIDYAGAAAVRYIHAGNASHDHLRHLLKEMPLMLKTRLAKPYKCTVYVNHQLAGDVQDRAPGVALHHKDSAEAKSFAENLDFCFCVGNTTLEGLALLNCSKHRSAAAKPPIVIRVDGSLSRVEDTGGAYVVDPALRQIVPAAEVARVDAGAARRAKGRPARSAADVE